MALIPERYFKSVIAIGDTRGPQVGWVGTGFLMCRPVDLKNPEGNIFLFLVTNKHVLTGMDSALLKFENANGTSSELTVMLRSGTKDIWIGHPDPEVDVAVVAIEADTLFKEIGKINVFHLNNDVLTFAHKEAANLCEGDGIFLLGYPMGMVDPVQNLPIVRSGILARIKDCRAGRSKTFLIDCQTFPGNSGGPVLIRPEAMALTGTTSLTRSYLLGIVSGYHTFRDIAVSRQTGREKIIFEENSGLSIVYPMHFVAEAMELAVQGINVAHVKAPIDDLLDKNEVHEKKD